MKFAAPRPAYVALASERAQLLPTLEDALARYLNERETQEAEGAALSMAAGCGLRERAG
jgi:hypothetical protein